jgi:hypothetical protein
MLPSYLDLSAYDIPMDPYYTLVTAEQVTAEQATAEQATAEQVPRLPSTEVLERVVHEHRGGRFHIEHPLTQPYGIKMGASMLPGETLTLGGLIRGLRMAWSGGEKRRRTCVNKEGGYQFPAEWFDLKHLKSPLVSAVTLNTYTLVGVKISELAGHSGWPVYTAVVESRLRAVSMEYKKCTNGCGYRGPHVHRQPVYARG